MRSDAGRDSRCAKDGERAEGDGDARNQLVDTMRYAHRGGVLLISHVRGAAGLVSHAFALAEVARAPEHGVLLAVQNQGAKLGGVDVGRQSDPLRATRIRQIAYEHAACCVLGRDL